MSETRFFKKPGSGVRKDPTPTPSSPAPSSAPSSPSPVAASSRAFRVALVDHPGSGAPGPLVLAQYAAAMQKSLDRDFLPAYGKTASVVVLGDPSQALATDRVLGLFADPDQPGALGYHDLAPNGMPYGKIFPLLDAQDDANLSTTIDHELKELLEDATIDLSRMGSDGQFWADEACDAVESDEYVVDSVKLSNFVLPAWYSGVVVGSSKYDFLGKLAAPLTVGPGGYAQYFDPAQGWQQIQNARKAPRKYRRHEFTRSARRYFHRRGPNLTPPAKPTATPASSR